MKQHTHTQLHHRSTSSLASKLSPQKACSSSHHSAQGGCPVDHLTQSAQPPRRVNRFLEGWQYRLPPIHFEPIPVTVRVKVTRLTHDGGLLPALIALAVERGEEGVTRCCLYSGSLETDTAQLVTKRQSATTAGAGNDSLARRLEGTNKWYSVTSPLQTLVLHFSNEWYRVTHLIIQIRPELMKKERVCSFNADGYWSSHL